MRVVHKSPFVVRVFKEIFVETHGEIPILTVIVRVRLRSGDNVLFKLVENIAVVFFFHILVRSHKLLRFPGKVLHSQREQNILFYISNRFVNENVEEKAEEDRKNYHSQTNSSCYRRGYIETSLGSCVEVERYRH